jgi:transcriptional regulator with XRE-family HTH domain
MEKDVTDEHVGPSRLARLRFGAGLTQAELSQQSGVCRDTISRAERGGSLTMRSARSIADALGVSLGEVFG